MKEFNLSEKIKTEFEKRIEELNKISKECDDIEEIECIESEIDGMKEGRELTAKEICEQLIIDVKHFDNAEELTKIIKKRLEVEYETKK